MKEITNDTFLKGLSDAEWDKAEAIESEIAELLREGFTEAVGIKFVRTVMEIRTAMPDATVGGVFDFALMAGLAYAGDKSTLARLRSCQPTEVTNGIKPKGKRNAKGVRAVRGVRGV